MLITPEGNICILGLNEGNNTMKMKGKRVLVYGAAGGLGSSICRLFIEKGCEVVMCGRNYEKLADLNERWGTACEVKSFSILDEIDPMIFAEVDAVINAAGMDIRKPLSRQSQAEIRAQLDVNLFGAINLTKSALHSFSRKGSGQILHIGGFADGSWTMPYYTVDIATRAGMYSFIESVNLEIDNKEITVQYFCPQPADTDAERPFHELWKRQGLEIVSSEKVAEDIFISLERSREVTIQGPYLNRIVSTKLKYLFPRLMKILFIKPMGRMTMSYLDSKGSK